MDQKDIDFLLREKYAGVPEKDFKKDLEQLAQGEPVDYIIGWKPFLDCKIFLDSRPLIPRAETEYWVEEAIEEIKKKENSEIHILDLFTGSGAIGVALLKQLPTSKVDFGEIDTVHFSTIRKNLKENVISEDRHTLINTDVWSAITSSYQYIFANPPYLSEIRKERIQDSVLRYEPSRALFAKESGFEFIQKTIEGAALHLILPAVLYIEHEPEQSEALITLAKKAHFFIESRKDQYGKVRYSRLQHTPGA